jgi:oligoendopeptidase F
MKELPLRTTIDNKYRWNAESVFPDAEAWQTEFKAVSLRIPSIQAFAGTLSSGPEVLEKLLSLLDELDGRLSTLMFYAAMSSAVDTSDEGAQSLNGQAGALYGRYSGAVSFVESELLALGEKTLNAWFAGSKELRAYTHWMEDLLRKQAHVRSAEVEELLGSAEEVFAGIGTIHSMQVDSDLKFLPAKDSGGVEWPIAQSTVEAYLSSPDRTLRQNAWYSFCDSHLANGPSLAATLVTSIKKDAFLARARRYGSSLEAALFSDNIPRAAYENTLDTFAKHQGVWHRYWKVRKKALGVERLQHWDIWAPLTRKAPEVTYEQAVDWISSALAPLGKEYTATLRKGCLEDRWVDVYPTKGKSSGAFSYGSRLTHPFIMASYSDDLSALSTLTHELGHSMHSAHTWKAQPGIYTGYSIFVAEVASNFHQAMTRAWLFEHETDSEFQIALIEEAMENFHRYFFIMPTLARFEREVHRRIEEGQGVTAGDLNTLMADLFSEGYGAEMTVERDREGSTWAQFSHLYANFYVFQYATGISAAHALAAPILAGDKDAAKRYIDFLSCGSSLYPIDALKKAGIDMTTPDAIEKAFAVLGGLIDRLERLIAERK